MDLNIFVFERRSLLHETTFFLSSKDSKDSKESDIEIAAVKEKATIIVEF